MTTKSQHFEGFTLVELLIVVAVIAVLAAIAIPQFAVYREKVYNATAHADLKNVKTVLEAFYTERNHYPF